MAKREALQQLQSRIARLLQQASTNPAMTATWLGVRVGAARLLLPLAQSGEIYPASNAVRPVPFARSWFLGVTALRGNIVGVVDMRFFLPDAAAAADTGAAQSARRRMVAVSDALGVNVVLMIDALEGLRGRDDFAASSPPPKGAAAHLAAVWQDKQGKTWQEIDLQALVQAPGFLDIGRSATALPVHTALHA